MKRIGFVSTRIAGTDGVSLETFKWCQVLERNGYKCFFFAGELDTPAERSLVEPLAHFEHPDVAGIGREVFGSRKRDLKTTARIHELSDHLKEQLYGFCRQFQVDLLIPENALAIPMNIPLAMAITELVAETGMPTIAHHHDFSWERKRFLINAVQDFIQYAFPPNLPTMRHVVINSEASRQLSFRRGISNVIIPNVFDFASPPPASNAEAKHLRRELGFQRDDCMVLQPTRVVPRKWIERAVELVSLMDQRKPRLVVSHGSGDEGDKYAERVLEYARRLGVEVLYVGDRIGSIRCFQEHGDGVYTMDDVYQAADLITYPSGYEGFGNAFLEAIYFRKPIVVNRYSIFVEDIEPCGFDVISFESFVTRQIVDRIKWFLEPEHLAISTRKNYELGKKFFSYEVLETRLLPLIESF
ncbi:MAG: glycosyltransferase family 4 protein [Deltaproteobacteria bacterium]|nr:glycosyltransferase family 4 protein [Deltaproteobacteria bacterium]